MVIGPRATGGSCLFVSGKDMLQLQKKSLKTYFLKLVFRDFFFLTELAFKGQQ